MQLLASRHSILCLIGALLFNANASGSSPIIYPSAAAPAPVAGAMQEKSLAEQIDAAIETGDGPRLLALVRPISEPAPGTDRARENIAIARAWLLLGEPARARPFAVDAARHGTAAPARWLAAEAFYATEDFSAGDAWREELRARHPDSPALEYLEARRLLARIADRDADFDQPTLAHMHAEARLAASRCTDTQAMAHPDFDARFLSLGIDVARHERDYALGARYSGQLAAMRPRNPGLARLALAFAFSNRADRDALLDAVQARGTLSENELRNWRALARRHDEIPDAAQGWAELARLSTTDDAFASATLLFFGRAADAAISSFPDADARRPAALALLRDYARAALATRSRPHARHVVACHQRIQIPLTPKALGLDDESCIALLSFAGRHTRAAQLARSSSASHAEDFDWLARHRTIIARHAAPEAYLYHLFAMERLRPDDGRTVLELARVTHRGRLPIALAYYQRAFALTPAEIRPGFQDWAAYADLLEAAVERGDTIVGIAQPSGPDNVPDHLDHIAQSAHLTHPDYVVAAHYEARRLLRVAQAAPTVANWRAFVSARDKAFAEQPGVDPLGLAQAAPPR